MNRLEQAKRQFHDWEREQDKSDIMYSKNAHEVVAWLLYEHLTDLTLNNADNAEIAEFSRAFIEFGESVIEE